MKLGYLAAHLAAITAVTWGLTFDWAFPRSGGIYFPSHCNDQYCSYSILFSGWPREYNGFENSSFVSLNLDINGTDFTIVQNIAVDFANKQVIMEYPLDIQVKRSIAYQDFNLRIALSETNETILNERRSIILLDDVNELNGFLSSGAFEPWVPPSKSELHKRDGMRLAYIEVGTSNFNTIAERVSLFDDPSLVYGASVEPIASYLRQLPRGEVYQRVNAAIFPLSQTNNDSHIGLQHYPDVVEIYHIPESVIEKVGLDRGLKGCSTINKIHTQITANMFRQQLPSSLIQRSLVPTINLTSLLNRYVYDSGFMGLVLLKLDLEGLDQSIISDVLDFYDDFEALDFSYWPCVMVFETNQLSGYRQPNLMQRLKDRGYTLFHEYPIVRSMEEQGEGGDDTVAINCKCPEIFIRQANHLAAITSESLMTEVCSQNT